MTMPAFPPSVPILGKPFEIVAHYPTVVIQCQCEKKATLVLIGTQNVVTCPACQHRYLIVDEMQVKVGAMRPAMAELVQ